MDVTGIIPEEGDDGANATTIVGPTTDLEEHVEEKDLGAPDVPEEEYQAEYEKRVGFLDENGERLPEAKADLDDAKPDCRPCRPRPTENERLGWLFGSRYIQWKGNVRQVLGTLHYRWASA